MRPSFLRLIAIALVVAIVLILGLTTGGAFAHEVKHAAHHSAGMHATGICAWMCAVGGALTTQAIQPLSSFLVQFSAPPSDRSVRSLRFSSLVSARAPPVLL